MGLVNNLSVSTEEIIDYLHKHPDFFVSHPELLNLLSIPHDTIGDATSLIEYQAVKLRQKIIEFQTSLEESEARANINREFSKAVHDLVLKLQATQDNIQLYNTLNKGLRIYYQADRVLFLIFNDNDSNPDLPDLRFLKPNSKLALMFTEVVHRNKPLCGSLQEEHLLTLFQNNIEEIKSTVLIPVKQKQWNGLLVLGSGQAERYSHGYELDLLVFIAAICAQKITPMFMQSA